MFLVGNTVSSHALLERERSLALTGPKLLLAVHSGVAILGNNSLAGLALLLLTGKRNLGVTSCQKLVGHAGAFADLFNLLESFLKGLETVGAINFSLLTLGDNLLNLFNDIFEFGN